jgi:hypothetical protein
MSVFNYVDLGAGLPPAPIVTLTIVNRSIRIKRIVSIEWKDLVDLDSK